MFIWHFQNWQKLLAFFWSILVLFSSRIQAVGSGLGPKNKQHKLPDICGVNNGHLTMCTIQSLFNMYVNAQQSLRSTEYLWCISFSRESIYPSTHVEPNIKDSTVWILQRVCVQECVHVGLFQGRFLSSASSKKEKKQKIKVKVIYYCKWFWLYNNKK